MKRMKSAKSKLPSFWVPSMTPSTTLSSKNTPALKLQPLCPLSGPTNKHNISLKSLIAINFRKNNNGVRNSSSSDRGAYICPACDKNLTNSLKAVMTIPCGHVLCKPCAGKFMSADQEPPDPHASPGEQRKAQILCYVCETDLSAPSKGKKTGDKVDKEKEKVSVKPGLVELKSEGTGFAGGGDNMVSSKGTAFQC